ncbi:MAG: hypothetical protein PVI30_01945 [Myxococcales bacterium]|jgi:hypothetical protein
MHERSAIHPWVAFSQLGLAALITLGVWAALPARWLPVDVLGSALAALQAAAAVGLMGGQRWARRLSRVAAWTTLGLGATVVTALSLVVSHLAGLYGPVGAGGALLMGAMAALVLPYLVGVPFLQLRALRERGDGA